MQTQHTEREYERIDGREYELGSREHGRVINLAVERVTRYLTLNGITERMDAPATAFLARDLVNVTRDVQKVLYDRLRAKDLIPITNQIDPGAEAWVYELQSQAGRALVGANLQADDHPLVDIGVEEFVYPLINISAGYAYNVGELERAAFSGRPLQRDKANACAEAIARALDEVGLIGKPDLGIYGLLNNPNVPDVTLTNGEWLTATAAEILADLAQIEQAATTNSRDNFAFDTLLLPTAYEARLRTLPIDASSGLTVAQYFFGSPDRPGTGRMLRSLDRVITLDEATGTSIGVSDAPMGLAYTKDPQVLTWDIPITYREETPQARNFKWVVPARARSAGVVFKQPTGALYIQNLD